MNGIISWENLFCKNATPINKLDDYREAAISIKRDDLNHKIVQGNKLRKLKYNILYALEHSKSYIATFGGAWSNHILASAQAASLCGIRSIGFIRGDELCGRSNKWSSTLIQAKKYGMELVFLSRAEYRLKEQSKLVHSVVRDRMNDTYFIPEGGSNLMSLKGVAEIIIELHKQNQEPTHIITACGTGGTMAGLIQGVVKTNWSTKIIGVPVLKNGLFLKKEIANFLPDCNQQNWQLYDNYHFGGYAKINQDLRQFGKSFVEDTQIDLDKIYNAKSFYAAYDLIKTGEIPPNSRLIILHTGGLQGGSVVDGKLRK